MRRAMRVVRRDGRRVRLLLERLEERVTPSLVAAYNFDEGAGAVLHDYSGNGNNGTVSNATWSTAGKYGGALQFSGVANGWVTVPDSASLGLTAGLSIEAWVRPTAASTDWAAVAMKERPGGLAYALYASDGAAKPPAGYINRGGTDVPVTGTGVLPLNAWSHLAVTYDGAALRLYVNGAQVASRAQTGSITTSAGAFRIGGDSVWGEYFTGLIDDVRVYNTAQTQAQIQTDMNTPLGGGADTQPPSVAMTAPANNSTVSGTVTVSATASDNVAVASVQFKLDGANLGGPVTAAPYSISWNTTTAAAGAHTLSAVATDPSGNAATATAVSVVVSNADTTPPSVSFTAPANNSSVSGTVAVSATATDNVAVASVQFQVDGVNLGSPDTAAPYSTSWDARTASAGAHTLTAVATDTSGNTATATVTVTVTQSADTTPPTVAITAPANNSSWAGSLTLAATAGDNVGVASVRFTVDGIGVGAPVTSAPYQVAWDSSAVADGSHTITATATDGSGNTASSSVTVRVVNRGSFGPVINTPANPVNGVPVVPMHAALLDNGKILFWDGGPDCLGAISPTLWDPVAGTFTAVPLVTQLELRDLFCSAPTALADGRILVAGGHECVDPSYIGTAIANVFDPATGQWTFLPDMHDRRWYPSAITLPDGRALVVAGSPKTTLDYDPHPEIYDPVRNTWTLLSSPTQVIPNYPFVFVLPNGDVLAAGSDEAKMATYEFSVASQTWSVVDGRTLDAGSAVQYLPGKIMKTGSSYLSAPADNGGGTPSAATTYVLDTSQPNSAWQQTASMANPRTHLNLTILPDGTVLATGGSADIGGVNPAKAVYQAELWSPATQTWTPMASMQTPRLYHSTALLLPDGRVAVAGGGHNYYNNIAYPNAEIYSPPYLFKGARPTVTSAPSTLAYGSSFFVGTPDGANIASVALVHNGAVTHSFNMDQNYVPLTFSQTAGGLTVQAPANANLAPPGYYMLFVVNRNGVPSVAPFVRLPAPYEDTQAPTAPANLAASTGAIGSVTLNWTAATDNVGVTGYNVYRSATSGFTPSAATLIGQTAGTTYTDYVAAGTYYYLVTARDAAGNESAPCNQAVGRSLADTTAPTVAITAPAAGATVAGAVTVSANASDNVAVAKVQFFADGVSIGTVTAAPYTLSWGTASWANGTHTLTAVATDPSGNAATSAPVAVTVNNTAVGLVAAYNFDEGSGAVLHDYSGNGNNGTVSNASWSTAGKYGGALQFSGVANGWVTVPDSASLGLTAGLSIEAWVKPTAASTDWAAVAMKERPGGLAYALYASDGAAKPPAGYINRGGSDVPVTGTGVLPLNAWSHLAATYDGAALRLYVNGAQVASRAQAGAVTTSTSPFRIGGDSVWGEYFTGLIDDVRVYNRALSATEIQADMSAAVASAGAAAPMLMTTASLKPAAPNAASPTPTSGAVAALASPGTLSDARAALDVAAVDLYYALVVDPKRRGLLSTDSLAVPGA